MNIKSLLCSLLLFSFGTATASVQDSLFESRISSDSLFRCFQPNWCQIGNAGFSTLNPADWYEIMTLGYPITTPLSINRNRGSTQGNVQLTTTGIQIGQPGNYFVTIQVILTNNNPSDTPLIPIFLVRNGIFDPAVSDLGTIGMLPFGNVTVLTASGVVENVTAGTTLSIVATNGGSAEFVPITVVAWGISAFKIPCDPTPL